MVRVIEYESYKHSDLIAQSMLENLLEQSEELVNGKELNYTEIF
jgi:hypothetical protein